jgi:hypothetical protein
MCSPGRMPCMAPLGNICAESHENNAGQFMNIATILSFIMK